MNQAEDSPAAARKTLATASMAARKKKWKIEISFQLNFLLN